MKRAIPLWIPIISPFLIAGAAAGIAHLFFSPSLSALMLGPQLVSIEPSPKFICTAHKGDVLLATFTIRNVKSQPITLLGATASCSCTVAEGLPLKLDPGESGKVSLKITVGGFDETGKFTKSAQIFTNREGMVPPLIVEATALGAP
jgi:hypothetical protein